MRAYLGVGICEPVEESGWRGLAATRGREVIPKVTQNPTLTVPKPGKCTPGEPWEHHSDFLHAESTGTLRVLALPFTSRFFLPPPKLLVAGDQVKQDEMLNETPGATVCIHQ